MARAVAGMDLDQLRALTGQPLQLGGDRISAALTPVRVRRRKLRGTDLFTLVVRVDLVGAGPPVWRRVEFPSTLVLDELHDLLQLMFGWTGSHLHRFALGASVWDRDAELFPCRYDVQNGQEKGTPTHGVRLDEVLADVGDRLRYVYDYGDEWTLLLKVEKVFPGAPPRVRVTGGRRGAPPEDSGECGPGTKAPETHPSTWLRSIRWWRTGLADDGLRGQWRTAAGRPTRSLSRPDPQPRLTVP